MPAQMFRGDTWLRSWIVKDSNNNPIDLTGATARLHVRDAKQVLIHAASTSTAEIIITSLEGRIDLRIEATVSEVWAIGKYKYDLELTYSNGIVLTIESSVLTVIQDQTYD
jgi:hypothetical protein